MIRVGSGNVNACAPQESILSRAGVPDAGYGVAFPADTQGITTHMAQPLSHITPLTAGLPWRADLNFIQNRDFRELDNSLSGKTKTSPSEGFVSISWDGV